jgi:AcrR family transcriptional regulator
METSTARTRARRRPARYHHGNLREAALAEAVALVDSAGPDGLGLRELGRRLGVSHVAIHHHFPSVDALVAALAARWFADLDRAMAAAVAAIPPAQAIARFRALGVGYVHYALAHPHRYQLQFRAGPRGLVPEADASFRRVLDAVVACGRAIDPFVTTTLAWAAMHGLATLWLDGALRARVDRKAMDALVERVTALIAQLLEP